MSKAYNFVFVYEIKNRELDNILLLKCELERRGYSVKLIETWEQECHRDRGIKADVAVCFALYRDENLEYVSQFLKDCVKFVNLQWEQVFTNGIDDISADVRISSGIYGAAKKAVHISWGERNHQALTKKYGVAPENARVTGSVTLDFLREEFAGYYSSRKDICDKYSIESESRLCLFISSFSYADLPEVMINSEMYQNQGFDFQIQYVISKKTREIILDWFEKELDRHPDTTIIYRPHPAEAGAARLTEMEKKYDNFRVIGELSIKQWIIISDKLYTWWSTSAAEIYAAGKGCSILRPVEIPYENELQIYNGAAFITSFDEFDRTFEEKPDFPISKEIIDQFYFIDDSRPAFMKVCDILEEIIKNDDHVIDEARRMHYSSIRTFLFNFKCRIKKIVFGNGIIFGLFKKIYGSRIVKNGKTLDELKNEYKYTVEMCMKNKVSEEENEIRQERLRQILERYY